ncbi:multidrug transporter, partial [Salmonella enterica subsp. enterica serovar Typhimurium]|nr:multidrug transporter [Salmonella enterica subsp. enterica serovar Typhimurium]
MSRMVRITATNASTFLWQDMQWFKSVFILSSVLLKISSRP